MALARALFPLLLVACARGTFEELPDAAGPPPRDAGHTMAPADASAGDAAEPTQPTDDAGDATPHDAGGFPADDATTPPPMDAATADDAHVPAEDASSTQPIIVSEVVGGSGGGAFDDSNMLPATPEVKSVTISTADHLDRIELVLRSGSVFRHGGPTGNVQTLELAEGEAITSARLCTGAYQAGTRVFFVRLTSNQNRVLTGGTSTATCTDFVAPAGRQISGFLGRAGDVVDALGFLYTPLPAP
jgi:hypothetical protein